MNIRCLAIDDEPLALQQLVAYIGKVPFLELQAQCQSAVEAREFLEHDTVDAIFCDINMPDLNVDYLLKPFGLQEYQRAANRLRERLEGQREGSDIFLKTDYRIVKVSIPSIRYIEAMSEYLKVWIEGEPKPIITLLSMKKMEERLPDSFMRIHRSYIINLNMIQEVNKNRVKMDASTLLPIGDMYKDAFQAYLETKFIGK